jgi:hypothetical protein
LNLQSDVSFVVLAMACYNKLLRYHPLWCICQVLMLNSSAIPAGGIPRPYQADFKQCYLRTRQQRHCRRLCFCFGSSWWTINQITHSVMRAPHRRLIEQDHSLPADTLCFVLLEVSSTAEVEGSEHHLLYSSFDKRQRWRKVYSCRSYKAKLSWGLLFTRDARHRFLLWHAWWVQCKF